MKRHSTFLHYFVSYFFILCILLSGFIYITQTQLIKLYSDQLSSAVEQRLVVTRERFVNSLSSVFLTHNQLKNNLSLLNYRYEPNRSNRQALYQDMIDYATSNSFINSIIYLNKENGDVLSTKYNFKYKDSLCYIYEKKGNYEVFDIDEIETGKTSALFFLSNTNTTYLVCIPNNMELEYSLIYTINLPELMNALKDNMIDGMEAFALISPDTSQAYGIHASEILMAASEIPTQTGIYPLEAYSLYMQANIYADFSLAALFSNEFFSTQISAAFHTAYLLLFLIGLTGLFLIFFSMRLTYFPLANLAQKVLPHPKHSQNYINQLDTAFSTALTEKQQLQEKIDKYHLSIQKSLLDSVVDRNIKANFSNIQNIDQIFQTDCDNYIYMLRILFTEQSFPKTKIQRFLESMLPAGSISIVLESGINFSVYLVNYIGPESNKNEVIYSLMVDLYNEWGCFCAISNGVSSLTDIPSLYENTLLASNFWEKSPVTTYEEVRDLSSNMDNSIYPYKLLDKLNDCLKKIDFIKSRELLEELLAQIDQLMSSHSNYPDFIIRCLLIDILMTLFSSMNQHNIKFKLYHELYFETLYYCRSCNWHDKKLEITDNLLQMLELFQTEQYTIRTNQIQDYLEQNFASEDLSITTLAEYFHVSIAYMSYLFKKIFGENFVNYLWNLRFQKAVDMLLHTDMPIDIISKQVGYVNPSSFRRKFKQETGLTPSQFRCRTEQNHNINE